MLSSDIIARVETREREREARETQYILHQGVWKTYWIKSNSWTCCKNKDKDSTKCGETFEECIIARVKAAGKKRTTNHGNGVVYYGQMQRFSEFLALQRHGYGSYTFGKRLFGTLSANGDKYVGEWKTGKMDGNGTFTYANGNKYVGEFKNNKMDGNGTYTWASGNKYVGEFKNKMDGNGTFTYANGDKYVGQMKDDHFHGQGTKTLANGTIDYSGEWVYDEPKE